MALDGVNGTSGANPSDFPRLRHAGKSQKQEQPASIWIKSNDEANTANIAAPNQKMSRKEAKAWVKEYQESNNCSKKEAKAAFKEKFGYDVPASFWKKALRFLAGADVQIKGKKTTENKPKLYDAVSEEDNPYAKRPEITSSTGKSTSNMQAVPEEENPYAKRPEITSSTGKSTSNMQAIPEEDNPYAKGPKLITNTTKGVTSSNNSYVITKDKDGNSVCRVDYGNNNSKAAQFDEEEVRTPEGKLKSFTTRSYSSDGTSWYKKSEYDDNGNLIKVTETTCDSTGKVIGTKNLNIKDEPQIAGHVSIGTPVDGVNGDPELQKALEDGGFTVIGRN